jgi:hypothetical protein
MPSPRFEPGNQEGKKRGPNKISGKVRDSIVKFLEDNTDKIQESFDELKPVEKLKFVADILSYAVPKLSSVDTNHEGEITHEIKVTWEKPPSTTP